MAMRSLSLSLAVALSMTGLAVTDQAQAACTDYWVNPHTGRTECLSTEQMQNYEAVASPRHLYYAPVVQQFVDDLRYCTPNAAISMDANWRPTRGEGLYQASVLGLQNGLCAVEYTMSPPNQPGAETPIAQCRMRSDMIAAIAAGNLRPSDSSACTSRIYPF